MVNQELEQGLVSIRAPIRDGNQCIIIAMKISEQANRTLPQQMVKKLLPPLRESACRVSALLQRR